MNPTVIIPTIRADPRLLAQCVEGVRETTGLVPVVVDGPCTFSENCNRGAEIATGDLLVFLNDDTELLTGWLEPLVAAFGDPKVGIAGSRLVYPDGRLQHAGVAFRTRDGVLEAFNITDFDLPTRSVEAVTGACLAIRSDLFTELGGFSTDYRNGYEDVDLCLRATTAGWQIRYVRESTVMHHESRSGQARWSHVRENIALLQERWA